MRDKLITLLFFCIFGMLFTSLAADSTYAEKLGYPKGSKVLILHVDDVGMSYDSNEGAINAITKGIATSCSVMMPCSWVPAFVQYMKQNPGIDAGLHLTLTSEWQGYRWGPISGKNTTPGLVDGEGAMWHSVAEVVKHATPDEVEKEIRAQLDRARSMGFEPTHFDSHMGTLFESPDYITRYVKVGIENKIPVMLPAGHVTLIRAQTKAPDAQVKQLQEIGKLLWASGLPVLDDLHNVSYGWKPSPDIASDDKKLKAFKTEKYIEAIRSLQPGLTMMIMHCTATTEVFANISDSGPSRKGDMLTMMDPAFKKAIQDQGIILTTWREVMAKRQKIKN